MFIGIDDTDSEKGLCTTYLAAVLMERLCPLGKIIGLPKLIRLNPCVRFKTRGNAAIALELDSDRYKEVIEIALKTVLELSDLSGANTNPGLVIAEDATPQIKQFYQKALTQILEIEDAKELLDSEGIWHRGFKNGRGLIGALAAIGADLTDYTYELIAYRERHCWGTPRSLDAASVWKADSLTYPKTWDTVDYHNKRIVFAPHSDDPILFGIRGCDVEAIEEAFKTIISEPCERKVLYETNQGTDAHILDGELSTVEEGRSYRVHGVLSEQPYSIKGGHLFFYLLNGKDTLKCAAFEPTKNFRNIVKKLVQGDHVEVYGAVRDKTLNLEKMNILALAKKEILLQPRCAQCGRRMESAGKEKGYRCRRCKTQSRNRECRILPRDLEAGFYEVPPSARRHLSKPLVRVYGDKVYPSR